MITINNSKRLYIPLWYYKANNVVMRFNVEDCLFTLKEGDSRYLFPVSGRHEHYFHYLEWRKTEIPENSTATENEAWGIFVDECLDKGSIDSFELLQLNPAGLFNILGEYNRDGSRLIKRPRTSVANTLHFRSRHSDLEQLFQAAYSVTQDIPKALTVAFDVNGDLDYKGNYAVIDLEHYFKTGKISYERS